MHCSGCSSQSRRLLHLSFVPSHLRTHSRNQRPSRRPSNTASLFTCLVMRFTVNPYCKGVSVPDFHPGMLLKVEMVRRFLVRWLPQTIGSKCWKKAVLSSMNFDLQQAFCITPKCFLETKKYSFLFRLRTCWRLDLKPTHKLRTEKSPRYGRSIQFYKDFKVI